MSNPTTCPRERPILFSSPMVRAILEGRKTQTRRPVKGEPRVRLLDRVRGDFPFHTINACAGIHAARMNKHGAVSVLADDGTNLLGVKPGEFEWLCPYGAPGDRLWVREMWGPFEGGIIYRASEAEQVKPEDGRWHPAIHMHRSFSRITLEVVRVRVERLQEITEEDAAAEGLEFDVDGTPESIFGDGWDAMYARKPELAWSANPWVWVVEFKRIKP